MSNDKAQMSNKCQIQNNGKCQSSLPAACGQMLNKIDAVGIIPL